LYGDVLTVFLLIALGEPPRIVYPRLLEARSSNNSLSLYINDEITLNLERADIFPEMFVLQYPEGEGQVHEYMKGAELNNLVYHDTDQMSAVSIERDDGFYVNGIIRNTHRITPMYHMERSETGILAHELVRLEE
ncbi:salivary gland metalloprotease, putative, partial [Ixodes scapularis]